MRLFDWLSTWDSRSSLLGGPQHRCCTRTYLRRISVSSICTPSRCSVGAFLYRLLGLIGAHLVLIAFLSTWILL